MAEVITKREIKDIFKILDMCKLNERDETLINSMEEFFEARGYLTQNQKEVLMDIYERSDSGKR